MLVYDVASTPTTTLKPTVQQVLDRIGVSSPYFALQDMALEGRYFAATATAEAPPYLERGPMTAAEVGRHAAIAGLCHAALSQTDDRRRYYLAQRAECRYFPNQAPYGTPVRLQTEVRELTKRQTQVTVKATATKQPFAELDISYTILTEATFQRLFKSKTYPTQNAGSPYRNLLQTSYQRGDDWAEQSIADIPVTACAGHFNDYPALPVAVLMGQLAYLAGQIVADEPRPFRVRRGLIEASDLCWSDETARFRAQRTRADACERQFSCTAYANDRQVGAMTLWLELVR